MYKKSVKLTAIGLGLVSFALVSCKSKNDNKNNESANPNPVEKTTENKNLEKLEVSFSADSLSLKGGCATVNVHYYDDKGKMSPNLVSLQESKDITLSLDTNSISAFKLNKATGEVCSNDTTTNGKIAKVIAKYNNKIAEGSITASDKVFNVIKSDLEKFHADGYPSGHVISFGLNGYSNSSSSHKLETLTDTNYKVEVIDSSNNSSVGTAKYNSKVSKWEFNTKVLAFDPNDNNKNTKKLILKATNISNKASFETDIPNITISKPVVKNIKINELKSNYSSGTTNKLNIVFVYSNDDEKEFNLNNNDLTEFKGEIFDKDARKLTDNSIVFADGALKIKENVQDFKASNNYYILELSGTSSKSGSISAVQLKKKFLFVIGENKPSVELKFNELSLSGSEYNANSNDISKKLAKGADNLNLLHSSVSNDKVKACVKVVSKLKVDSSSFIDISNQNIITLDDEAKKHFTLNNNIVCAKRDANLGAKASLIANFQDMNSQPLTVEVDKPLLSNNVAPGVNGKNAAELQFNSNPVPLVADIYHTYTDGTLSDVKAIEASATKFKFTLENSEYTPFKLYDDKGVWKIAQKENDLAASKSDQVATFVLAYKDANSVENPSLIEANSKLTVKFIKAAKTPARTN